MQHRHCQHHREGDLFVLAGLFIPNACSSRWSRRRSGIPRSYLFLPLSNDGENQVLVVQVFLYIDPATRQRRFIEPRPFKEIAHLVFEVPSGVEMARR